MSKRITETQIVSILKEADVGFSAKELCRKYDITSLTFYKWKSKYGGIEASDVKRLKELKENRRFKQIYADLSLKSQIQEEFIN
ncbi:MULTISPECIES: transposase [unclassified Psychrobacter]|uniref:transposase n=1 Tax=unclassified Psychrobacter TaxID=196806 RepID=UPI003F45216A